MERMLLSPSGVLLRMGAGMRPDVPMSPLLSVHFSCVRMAPPLPPAAAADDADFCFSSPFSGILHEPTWDREAQRMMLQVAGNLVDPDDLLFLVRAFCDYSHDAIRSFYAQGGFVVGLSYIFVLLQIPAAAAAAAGLSDPPPRPHLPGTVVRPYDHLAYPPEVLSPAVNWGGGGAAAVFGNNPASTSALQQLKRVVFGSSGNGGYRETSCAICIEDFEAASVLSVMPCGHGFHSACLDEWLRRSNSCPLCRFSLPAAD